MFGKLLKREFSTTYKTMLPLYAALIVAAGAGRLLNLFLGDSENGIIQTIANLVRILNNIILILAVFLTLYTIAQRVYTAMIDKKEALESTVRLNLYAILSVAVVWCVLTYSVTVIGYRLYHASAPYYFTLLFSTDVNVFTNLMSGVILFLFFTTVISIIFLGVAIGDAFTKLRPKRRQLASFISGVLVFAFIGCVFYFSVIKFSLFEKITNVIGNSFIESLNDYGVFSALIISIFTVICFEIANAILNKRLK